MTPSQSIPLWGNLSISAKKLPYNRQTELFRELYLRIVQAIVGICGDHIRAARMAQAAEELIRNFGLAIPSRPTAREKSKWAAYCKALQASLRPVNEVIKSLYTLSGDGLEFNGAARVPGSEGSEQPNGVKHTLGWSNGHIHGYSSYFELVCIPTPDRSMQDLITLHWCLPNSESWLLSVLQLVLELEPASTELHVHTNPALRALERLGVDVRGYPQVGPLATKFCEEVLERHLAEYRKRIMALAARELKGEAVSGESYQVVVV